MLRRPDGLRVPLTTHVPVARLRAVRCAVAYAAPAGTPDTPPGGIRGDEFQTTCAVRDGVTTVWTHRHFG